VIKIVFCLRRKPGLSFEEFQRYWREDHAALVSRHASTLKIRRYVQSHTFHDPRIAAGAAARGSSIAAYDGVAELWWESIDDLIEATSTEEGRAASLALRQDESNFVDLAESPIFYARDNIVVSG
jgi:uncharacterized protein (TIGR02118 family)